MENEHKGDGDSNYFFSWIENFLGFVNFSF